MGMHIDLWPVSFMWRASLLALGGEAAPKPGTAICLNKRVAWMGAASRPSASKLARHSKAANSGQGGICL